MVQLNIRNLKKSFGERELLKDVSLSLSYRERVGIVGLNGCGKSTLFNLICGLDEPDSGQIHLHKKTLVELLKQEPEETEGTLSGGEKARLEINRILNLSPDLLLLDEPTNNLDFQAVNNLIYILSTYEGTILVISHDRYFLDSLVSRVIELDDGEAVSYNGGYTDYREEKKRLFNEALNRYDEGKKQQKRIEDAIKKTKEWSEKAHRESRKKDSSGVTMGFKEYNRVKAKKMDNKVKSDVKRLEKLITVSEKRPEEEKKVSFSLKSGGAVGKRILEAKGISKSYDNKILFSDTDFYINRGEKVALFGENGCGKTTFIKIIEGLESCDYGELWVSNAKKVYILKQSFEQFPKNITVMDYLTNKLNTLSGEDRTKLNNLGISAKMLMQKVDTLSYGEQMKLKLIEPILDNRDFIILDEPTNHLDLHAREMLENTLRQYTGTLLVVSHDIYFLKEVCNKVLVFEGSKIRRLESSFAEYIV